MRRFRLIQGPMKVDVDRQIGGLCELQDRPPAKVGFVTLHRNIRIRDIDELLRLTRDPLHVQVLFELLLSENMARLADGLEENGVPSLRLLRFTAHLYRIEFCKTQTRRVISIIDGKFWLSGVLRRSRGRLCAGVFIVEIQQHRENVNDGVDPGVGLSLGSFYMATFIVDCPSCKAKVAAEETGRAEDTGFDHEVSEPYGWRLFVGKCPRCTNLLAAESQQLRFKGWEGDEEDVWSDPVRVHPKPTCSARDRCNEVGALWGIRTDPSGRALWRRC